MMLNMTFGWIWIGVGLIAGTLLGLGYHQEKWLGGYGSFRRRQLRLGHIACIALGMLNILFALSESMIAMSNIKLQLAAWLLIIGAVSMPTCCVLTAWRSIMRNLFVIPIVSLVFGVLLVLMGMMGGSS